MGNLINELLKESNNKYIIFIGSTDYWDELVSYSDEYYVDWCVIDNTRIDYFNPRINKYHESRWANKKPDLVLTEFIITKIPKELKNKLNNRYKVMMI